MNLRWNYLPPTQEQKEEASRLSKAIGISPILCKLLIKRGLKSKDDIDRF